MQFHAELCFVPDFKPDCGFNVFAHEGGVLLLPAMRGVVPGPAWWAEDGVHFVEVPIDGSAVGLEPEPKVNAINDHHWATDVSADGRAFFWHNHRMVSATIGPRVAFELVPYQSPVQWKFKLEHLTVDEAGTWWAAGHASHDEIIGQIFTSRDAVTWQQVPSKIDCAVKRLFRAGGKMYGIHYKHVSVVTADGVTKLASMKDHIDHAIFTPSITVGLGNGFIGVLPAGAKRCTYVAPPNGGGRFHLAAVAGGGFVSGGSNGLWSSPDAKAWEPVPSFTGYAVAIVPSRSGAIVLNERREVYVVRGS